MIEQRKTGRPLFDMLFWPALLGFIFLSVILALQWFFSVDIGGSFLQILDYSQLAAAGVFQALALLVVILAWLLNLRQHGLRSIDFLQAATMVGINAIGKYSPGKVWGILARGSALLKLAGNRNTVIQATLIEQLALFHSGGVLALLAFCFHEGYLAAGLASMLLALLSVAVVARGGILVPRLKALLGKYAFDVSEHPGHAFKTSYIIVFTLLGLVWLLSALVLYFSIAAYQGEVSVGIWEIMLITTLAYLSGFLAFFSFAGLGVREGVMTAMLSLHMDLSVALYISIIHRFITLLFDVMLGCFALVSSKSLLRKRSEIS